jgi:hypothetical protein
MFKYLESGRNLILGYLMSNDFEFHVSFLFSIHENFENLKQNLKQKFNINF